MREGENNGNFELQSNESTPSQTSTSANQEILSMEEVHFRESKSEKSSVLEARGDSETVLSDQPDQESIDNDSAIFSPLPKKSSVSSLPPCQIKLLMVQSRSHLHHRDHSRCQKKKSQIWQIRVQHYQMYQYQNHLLPQNQLRFRLNLSLCPLQYPLR